MVHNNFCKTGVFSTCDAAHSTTTQRTCGYFEKASYADRCMYFIEERHNHCDSLRAQTNAPIPNVSHAVPFSLDDLFLEEEYKKSYKKVETPDLGARFIFRI